MSARLCIRILLYPSCTLFFFNDTATSEIYTLSLHDALPIYRVFRNLDHEIRRRDDGLARQARLRRQAPGAIRSEEHTSELQSRFDLVCRLLLEKKKQHTPTPFGLVRYVIGLQTSHSQTRPHY